MPTNYDAIDFKFTFRGDFLVGPDGDIADTRDDQIQSMIQEVRKVTASALGDWEEEPQYGAGLDDFIGEPNTRATARSIERRIRDALTRNEIVLDRDLQIRIVPVGVHQLLIALNVDALATENNSVDPRGAQVTLLFDWAERGIYFVDRTE